MEVSRVRRGPIFLCRKRSILKGREVSLESGDCWPYIMYMLMSEDIQESPAVLVGENLTAETVIKNKRRVLTPLIRPMSIFPRKPSLVFALSSF